MGVLRGQIDDKKKEANVIQKAIASKKKAKEDADEEIMARKVIMSEVGVMEEELATLALARDSILNRIGNLVHESVLLKLHRLPGPLPGGSLRGQEEGRQ